MNQKMAMNINKALSQNVPFAKKDMNKPVGAPRNKTTATYNFPDQRWMAFDFFKIYLENWTRAVMMQIEPAKM